MPRIPGLGHRATSIPGMTLTLQLSNSNSSLTLTVRLEEWQNPDWSDEGPYEFYPARYVTCEPVMVWAGSRRYYVCLPG